MGLLDGNIAEGSPSSIATPPVNEVTPFFNTDFTPARFYYKDSTGTSTHWPGNISELEHECAETMEKMIEKITCALTNGNLTMTDFISFIAQGVTITGVATDDGNGNTTCNVTLSPTKIAVTSVSSSPSTLALAVSATAPIVATVLPANATNKVVYWISSNTLIATVNLLTGVVTGVSAGVALVHCVTADGAFISGTTTVTVS